MINEQDLVKALSVPAHILHRHTPVICVTRDVITAVIIFIPVVVAHTMARLGEGEGGPTRTAGSMIICIFTITSTVCMLCGAAIFSTVILQCLITATLTLLSTVLSTLYLTTTTTAILAQQAWYAGQEEGG